jgi:hypothetical protein
MLVSSSRLRVVGSPARTRSASASEHATSQYSYDAIVLPTWSSSASAMRSMPSCCVPALDEHDHLDAALPRCRRLSKPCWMSSVSPKISSDTAEVMMAATVSVMLRWKLAQVSRRCR